ncbi:MAG: hypothetical protein R3Y16_00400 [Rikenellaceae bacterium]
MDVKKTITTLALALSILGVSAQGSNCTQMGQDASKPTPDAKLLSSTMEGNYRVSKWLVKRSSGDEQEFSVRYRINAQQMVSDYDQNTKEIQGLHNFVVGIIADKEKSISGINIYGYASPDGGEVANQRLAEARAHDLRQYINSKYGFSHFTGSTTGVALPWSATASAVERMATPNKAAVLSAVRSGSSDSVIEQRLKSMPTSWSYIAGNILPPMRCVEVEVLYTDWCVVETRTLISQPRVVENNYFIIVEPDRQDILVVENPYGVAIDFEREDRRARSKYLFKENRRREKYKGYYYR